LQALEWLSQQAEFINVRVLPWMLRGVMFGLGLSLTLADFKRIIVFPKAATIGLAAQLVGLPAAAFLLAWIFNAPAAVAVGLVIIAACPSGVTSNAYSFAARADVPLCVTLSAITSVITVFSIPFLIELAIRVFFNESQELVMSAPQMLRNLMLLTIVPLGIGMLMRAVFTDFATRAVEPVRKIVLYFTIGVLILQALSSYEDIIEHGATAGALVLTMNVLTMALGYGAAKLFRLPLAQVITITFEVGVQNLALALAITGPMLGRPDLAVAALIYAVVMPATALAFLSYARRLTASAGGPEITAADAARS
jgi:bile acid:Na+ symporter, BASS family